MSARTDLHTELVPGDGPAVVFLHGLFGQGKNFATIARLLAPQYRSLLVDLPDHGSSAWTDRVDYTHMADTVADVIRDRLPGEQVRLVGHSMGGKTAMVLALRHPDLVERLVVVDISPVATQGMTQFEHLLGALTSLDLTRLTRRGEADAALADAIPEAGVRGFLLQNLRQIDGRFTWRANLALLYRDLPRIGSFPHGLDQHPYEGPVLWIAGADSPYVQPEHSAPMRALFPRVRKVSIKNAGHWVHSEQQQAFVTTLRMFLDAPAS